MKSLKYFLATTMSLIFLFMLPLVSFSREIPAIVSTDWLQKNLNNQKLVILDIRKIEEYARGHIPGAVRAYYGAWAQSKEGRHTEIPFQDDLFEALGDAGIRQNSHVVVVCNMSECYYQAQAPRVACTLLYAGIENAAILDGGFEKWVSEKRIVTTKITEPKKSIYKGILRKDLLADKAFVKANLGKAVFIDVRLPVLYSGEKKQEFIEKYGHIPGSINLPFTEAFTKTGLFKSKEELEAIAAKTADSDKSRLIITYCDAGKCCPTWAYIFREVLGYSNVKLYDGGLEEWTKDPNMPMQK